MRIAYLLGWSGSGKSTTLDALDGPPSLKGDRFLKRAARVISPSLDGSWHEPRFWEALSKDPAVNLTEVFLDILTDVGFDFSRHAVVEGTLFGWVEVIQPFHHAIESRLKQTVESRRFYLDADARTIVDQQTVRYSRKDRRGKPDSVKDVEHHLAHYIRRLECQGELVRGSSTDLVGMIRSYLAG